MKIASFQKTPFKQFVKDSKEYGFIDDMTPEETIKLIWDSLKKIEVSHSGLTYYKFFLPYSFCLKESGTVTIPTGYKAKLHPGYCLVFSIVNPLLYEFGLDFADSFVIRDKEHILLKLKTDREIYLKDGTYFANARITQENKEVQFYEKEFEKCFSTTK